MNEEVMRWSRYGWMDRELFPDRVSPWDLVEWCLLTALGVGGFVVIGMVLWMELVQ